MQIEERGGAEGALPPAHAGAAASSIIERQFGEHGVLSLLSCDPRPPGEILGRIGPLEARLATTPEDVRAAQRLRYEVFYREMSAIPSRQNLLTQCDSDEFDAICDHVLVVDRSASGLTESAAPLVGTYRLLRQDVAERHGGFYSCAEFEIGGLVARKAPLRFLELGRSCVLKPWRTKRTVELLWHAVWAYALRHRLDVMIGCASMEGTDPDRLALPLSFLHHRASAPSAWTVRALPERRVPMDRLPAEAIDEREALRALPPLIKGYLRLGAWIGDGAVIDPQFNTTDVCVILPVDRISERYIAHFGADAQRHAVRN